jgi:hypothetical protein
MILAVSASENLELHCSDSFFEWDTGERGVPAFSSGFSQSGWRLRQSPALRMGVSSVAAAGLVWAAPNLQSWNQRLDAELASRGFFKSNADPSLWIRQCDGGAVTTIL